MIFRVGCRTFFDSSVRIQSDRPGLTVFGTESNPCYQNWSDGNRQTSFDSSVRIQSDRPGLTVFGTEYNPCYQNWSDGNRQTSFDPAVTLLY